jgi:hypothetical protein
LKLRDVRERFILSAATFLLFTLLRDRLGFTNTKDYLILVGVLLWENRGQPLTQDRWAGIR